MPSEVFKRSGKSQHIIKCRYYRLNYSFSNLVSLIEIFSSFVEQKLGGSYKAFIIKGIHYGFSNNDLFKHFLGKLNLTKAMQLGLLLSETKVDNDESPDGVEDATRTNTTHTEAAVLLRTCRV